MDRRGKALIKNMGILTISNFASKILVFLLVPLYTSTLTTAEYGIYDLAISTVSLLYPILTLNIVDAVMRFAMDKCHSVNNVALTGIQYIGCSTVIVTLFLLVINRLQLWQDITGLEPYIFLYFIFYALDQYFIQLAKALDKIADMGVAGTLGTAVMLTSNILFLIVFHWGLKGFFTANILAQAIPAIYLFLRLRFWRWIRGAKTDKQLHKEMLLYCTPLLASAVGWWINSGSDRYVVTFFCGVAANGLLSVAYKIPSILNTLQGIFIQAWQISAIGEYGKQDTAKFFGETFLVTNTLMCAACSWLIMLTRPLAHLLYASDFYTAWRYVPFLLVSSVFNNAAGFLGPILAAKKDSRSMALSAVYGAGTNLILNMILVYWIGVQGAAIATVIASFIIYQVRRSAVGKEIIINRYKIVTVTWLILLGQSVIEIYTHLWFIEAILMMLMLVLNQDNIINIFAKAKRALNNKEK